MLAAGEGSRFADDEGLPKLLTPFRGRPLAAWALEAAVGAGFAKVVAVTGAVDLSPVLDELAAQVTIVHNPRWRSGQATSLRAGLDWCSGAGVDSAVVGLADQPLVPSSAWRAVGSSAIGPVVTAAYAGRRSPPVRLERSVWSLISGYGDEGARELMRRRPDLVREVACEGDPADVDTIEDLRRLEAASASNVSATAWTTERK